MKTPPRPPLTDPLEGPAFVAWANAEPVESHLAEAQQLVELATDALLGLRQRLAAIGANSENEKVHASGSELLVPRTTPTAGVSHDGASPRTAHASARAADPKLNCGSSDTPGAEDSKARPPDQLAVPANRPTRPATGALAPDQFVERDLHGCGHFCRVVEPYGFVAEAGCPVHDVELCGNDDPSWHGPCRLPRGHDGACDG